ncbi:MAG: hypothetical protein Q9166_001746 [cf. Caloplaca sp. 2 TL-2023]
MADISIYAELLLNIRQVTAVASLPSACNNTTSASLSSKDCHALSIVHEGQSASIKLPAPIRAGCVPSISQASTRALSFRLPITDEATQEILPTRHNLAQNNTWPASTMTPYVEIACRFCHDPLVHESVKTWKDLPSENWAEMMDFWHCHKPDTDDSPAHQQNGLRKGYGAFNSIEPAPGVGLVDITYLLLMRQDCHIALDANPFKLKNGNNGYTVNCASCKRGVGVSANEDCANVKIYKWNIRFRPAPTIAWEVPTTQKLISAQLLAMIESQGTQKFVIHSETRMSGTEALLVSTFKTIANPTEILEQQSQKIDELQLPTEVLQTLHSDIQSSTQLLPVPAQKFQDWDVGLLER